MEIYIAMVLLRKNAWTCVFRSRFGIISTLNNVISATYCLDYDVATWRQPIIKQAELLYSIHMQHSSKHGK